LIVFDIWWELIESSFDISSLCLLLFAKSIVSYLSVQKNKKIFKDL
jgi:hypothetical protein